MKKVFFALFFVVVTMKVFAQQPVIDVAAISAIVTTHAAENENLKKIAKKETAIAALQTKIALRQEQIKLLQDKVYNARKSAMSWVTTVSGVTKAYSTASNIVEYQNKIFTVASGDAALTAIALGMQLEIADRSYNLLQDVVIALLGGEIGGVPVNLMDSKQRLDLINRVNRELRILRGMVYGVYRKIRRIKRIGVFQTAKEAVTGAVLPHNSLSVINQVKSQYF